MQTDRQTARDLILELAEGLSKRTIERDPPARLEAGANDGYRYGVLQALREAANGLDDGC